MSVLCPLSHPHTHSHTHSPLHNSPSLSAAVGSLFSCSGEGHCHLAKRCPSAPVRRHLVSAVKLAENSPENREHHGNWRDGLGWVSALTGQISPSSWRPDGSLCCCMLFQPTWLLIVFSGQCALIKCWPHNIYWAPNIHILGYKWGVTGSKWKWFIILSEKGGKSWRNTHSSSWENQNGQSTCTCASPSLLSENKCWIFYKLSN